MKRHIILLAVCALFAGVAPVLFSDITLHSAGHSEFPGWPDEYEGKTLQQLSLSDKEQLFVANFPGKIARFSDGHREIIIRWVAQPTRMLHPASDCFKGIGYRITPGPVQVNHAGIKMGCFEAEKGDSKLNICEYIESEMGDNWSDISSWYWSALMTPDRDGWMSYVVASNL